MPRIRKNFRINQEAETEFRSSWYWVHNKNEQKKLRNRLDGLRIYLREIKISLRIRIIEKIIKLSLTIIIGDIFLYLSYRGL